MDARALRRLRRPWPDARGIRKGKGTPIATAYGVRPRQKRRKPGVIAIGILGQLLRELDGRMTVEELSHVTGIDAAVLSRLRGQKSANVSLFKIECLANAAGYDLKLVRRA